MLKTILTRLNGKAMEPLSVSEALAQLDRDRTAVQAEIKAHNEQRRKALLDDADDKALDKLEREIDRATVRLEKLNAADAPLRERLAAAKADEHKEAVDRHFNAIVAAYGSLRDAVIAAESAQRALMRARDTAIAEVGEHALSAFPIICFGGILGHGATAQWVTQNDSIIGRASRSRAPRKAAALAAPIPNRSARQKPQTLQHAVAIEGGIPRATNIPLGAKRTPDDLLSLRAGEMRCKVLRAGYSPADDRPQAHFGQVIRLPAGTAERAAAAGVVEIIETFSQPGTSAQADPT